MHIRNQLNYINKILSLFPATIITGVRQCGKTTLSRTLRPEWRYVDFENPADRDLVLQDPVLFFQNNPDRLILDEVQRHPEILQVLRGIIDADRQTPNRFILTGSASPELLTSAAESLAGRVSLVELSPLKTNELAGVPLPEFYSIFQSALTAKTIELLRSLTPAYSMDFAKTTWLRGGYPEPLSKNDPEFFELWYQNYIANFLHRDLRGYFPGIEIETYRRFLGILRDYNANEMNLAEISRSLGCSETTVRRYLEIAHQTFFWRKLPSYERTQLRSVVKTSRGLYRDSGILHHLLGIHDPISLEQSRFRGASFEGFVIEEIIRGINCSINTSFEANFYRTRGGAEVDLIVSGDFGILPIEIKLSTNVTITDVPHLKAFVEQNNLPLGIVITMSSRVELLSEKIARLPVTLI